MSLLDRLAHARALDRISPRPSARADAPARVRPEPRASEPERREAGFQRRELDLPLQPTTSAGRRGLGFATNEASLPCSWVPRKNQRARARAGGGGPATGPPDAGAGPVTVPPSTQSRASLRSSLLGGCLDRLRLPAAPGLARDLVCLGAHQVDRAVFLDTETTGLGGVAVPYVVGLAWIEDDRLRSVQWTLTRCSGEAELLADVLAQLETHGPAPLVSFNGASFDLPLLRVRAHRYGLSARVLDAEHVDLLHPARRLNRGRGRDCKLATLERELLGVHRRGDIDSAEIPAVFWDWVQSPNDPRAQRRLQAVCEHNFLDLATLPALAAWLAQAVREPGDLDRALRAAKHLERVGASDQARLVLSRWVEPERPPQAGRQGGSGSWRSAALELATFERRAGDRERAAQLWRAAWLADPGCPEASEAWAKHLEHQLGDFAQALRVARGSRDPCERRIARLEARLARQISRPELERPEGPRAASSASAAPEPKAPSQPTPSQPTPSQPTLSQPTLSQPASTRGGRSDSLLARIDETDSGAVVRYRLLR